MARTEIADAAILRRWCAGSTTTHKKEHAMRSRTCARIESLEKRMLLSTSGSGWALVDDFQSAGSWSIANALAVDRSSNPATVGTVYAVGYGKDAAGHYEGFVREKLPGSSSWQTSQDYVYASGQNTQFNGATVTSDGTLYVSGQATDESGRSHWIALRSSGGPLQLVDNFVPTSGHNSYGTGIVSDAAGNVFAIGYAGYSPNGGGNIRTYWFTRELGANATSFRTVDTFAGTQASGVAVAGSGSGESIYVVGQVGSNWTVRKGSNGGSSWSTVDSFSYTYSAAAVAVTADNSGNVFVAGKGFDGGGSGYTHWVVRESSSGGTSWATVDNWQLTPGQTADVWGIGLDAQGNVNVVGTALQNGTTDWAIIRNNAGPNGSWQVAEQYQYSPNAMVGSQFRAFTFATDPATGTTSDYAAGLGNLGGSNVHWVVLDPPVPVLPVSVPADLMEVLTRHVRRHHIVGA